MKIRQTLLILAIGCGSLAFLASGAAAAWLVASDGSRIEIDGPWKVEGKLVTFTLPNGTLGSMPITAVDLDASQALADKAAAAKEKTAQEPERPKAVMVITDADVGHPNLNSSGDDEEGPGSDSSQSPGEEPALRVTAWREDLDLSKNAVQISGTLMNPTENPATTIDLAVLLYDDEGTMLERSNARLERPFLNPGATLRFDAEFEETMSFDRVEFEIRSRGFMANPPADESESEEAEEDGLEDGDEA
jgi:hypothetical protein